MPSKKPRLATYTTDKTIKKFQFIADFEKRSASKELEYIVDDYINKFESNHGEIIVEENGKITIAKPSNINVGELSATKTG